MSSHWDYVDEVCKAHDENKPFAPENGTALKFSIGDNVTFTNDYGCRFNYVITGFYKPSGECSLYATGHRYLVDSDSPWFPIKETELTERTEP